jgi:Ca-activated chloride channel family protein
VSFIWPPMLLFGLAIPIGALVYLARERRRRQRLAHHRLLAASGGRDTPARGGVLRRRIPGALMLVGLAVLVIAMARPQGEISVPRVEGTVILSFDVSGSMAADDLKPSRMEAAKTAARAFVERQPSTVRIGVVAFSDSGLSIQVPTDDPVQVVAAIDRLAPERGTSIAGGIQASLEAIAALDADPAAGYYTNRSPGPTSEPTPVPAGTHSSAVIVLLSDGENTQSPDPIAAAQAAADRGVRIFTVGVGSAAGTTIEVEGFRIHSQLDETLLRRVSEVTDGTYYAARDPDELRAIYDEIETRLVIRPEEMELTSFVAGAGFLILLVGGLVSLRWLGRLP